MNPARACARSVRWPPLGALRGLDLHARPRAGPGACPWRSGAVICGRQSPPPSPLIQHPLVTPPHPRPATLPLGEARAPRRGTHPHTPNPPPDPQARAACAAPPLPGAALPQPAAAAWAARRSRRGSGRRLRPWMLGYWPTLNTVVGLRRAEDGAPRAPGFGLGAGAEATFTWRAGVEGGARPRGRDGPLSTLCLALPQTLLCLVCRCSAFSSFAAP
ncbi:MAG: hypothetical protein J3K34DRAFT_447404 [Monoraphidium minutum]|nr:MAG: hypothetical protein J3K34DRAFT_447404 [Monoraphidium minutum]